MKALLLLPFLLASAFAEESGFTPLFNGRDLTGWKTVGGNGSFTVDSGEIVGSAKDAPQNTFLRTIAAYRDFEFRFEFKFDTLEGNSGVMFRAFQQPGENGRVTGYQCEHDQDKNRAWTAGLYDEARRGWLVPSPANDDEKKSFTARGRDLFKWDDWNAVTIIAQGPRLRIYLNGELRSDFTDTHPEHFTPEGFIALQVHSGKACHVRWRNLLIKDLTPPLPPDH